jgi:DNA-binding NarL/FixJ family response regulator
VILSLRVLIVEDEFLIALNTECVLLDSGFQVTGIATSYETAVSMAERTRPDLVLMDIVLDSERDGVDAAIEISRRFGIPVVFTSANQDSGNVRRAKAMDVAGWVPKPYSSEKLLEAIRNVGSGLQSSDAPR